MLAKVGGGGVGAWGLAKVGGMTAVRKFGMTGGVSLG